MEFYEQEYKRHLDAAVAAKEEGDRTAERKNLLASVEFLTKLANGSQGAVKKNRLELADKLLGRAQSIPKDAGPIPGSIADARERAKQGLPPQHAAADPKAKAAEGGKEADEHKFVAVERP